MTQQFTSYDDMVAQVIETCGPDIRLATILGLGKPNRLINALYDTVKDRSDLSLTIFPLHLRGLKGLIGEIDNFFEFKFKIGP